MSDSTGPIIACGALTAISSVITHPEKWIGPTAQPVINGARLAIATAMAAAMFSLAERAWPEGAKALAYCALITVLFVRVDPKTPAPVEALSKVFSGGAALTAGAPAPTGGAAQTVAAPAPAGGGYV